MCDEKEHGTGVITAFQEFRVEDQQNIFAAVVSLNYFYLGFSERLGSGHLITSVLWIIRDCLFSHFQLISLCYLKRGFRGKFLIEELRNILLSGVKWREAYPMDQENINVGREEVYAAGWEMKLG